MSSIDSGWAAACPWAQGASTPFQVLLFGSSGGAAATWVPRLHDAEDLFQLDHELPVALLQVVAVVVLARVDGRAADLKKEKKLSRFYESVSDKLSILIFYIISINFLD
jgi:hypothetical protein